MADRYGSPWPKYRGNPPKILPPLRAVRHFCLDCCCEVANEVELCPAQSCPLWPFRLGTYPQNHVGPKTVLRPIKAKCKDCMPEPFKRGQVAVKDCEKKCCPIWPYRRGHNPARAGQGPKGGNQGFIKQQERVKLPDSRPSNRPNDSDEEGC